ncbi:MAG: hypothetical protein QF371_03910 [Flavobacteriales bacterium]|jgi:hypothetical protein|nr:hypothetical protein [Flavobacteriales bacterium]
MQVCTEETATFNCSIERAFKAPILGDATRFLTGYMFQPPIAGFEEDETWGTPGGVRFPVTNGNLLVPKGRLLRDETVERIENEYWKWMVYDFEVWSLFFTTKGVGEWYVKDNHNGTVHVRYIYTYTSRNWLTYPLNWLFVQTQVKGVMKKAIKGIQLQAESGEPFVYKN